MIRLKSTERFQPVIAIADTKLARAQLFTSCRFRIFRVALEPCRGGDVVNLNAIPNDRR